MKLLPEWPSIRIDTEPGDCCEAVLALELMPNSEHEYLFTIKFEAMKLAGYEKFADEYFPRANGALEELPLSVAIQMRDFLNYALRNVK